MKTRQILTIITIAIAIFIIPHIQNASAVPYLSLADLYKQSDMVFYGQVISKQSGPGPDYYYYQVKVDTYFKNTQNSDSITVAGHKSDNQKVSYPQFEVGDKAIFYINKLDGINTISSYSQKADSACSVESIAGPDVASKDNPIMRGVPTREIRILDLDGNAISIARTHQPIVLQYDDLVNGIPQARNVTVTLEIQKYTDTQSMFYQKQDIPMIACSFEPKPSWNFTPLTSGRYSTTISYDNKTVQAYFDVRDNFSTVVLDKSVMPYPLEQFKSGVAALDVKCKEEFMLVTKASDHSPACVKPLTYNALALRGWAILQGSTTTTYVTVGNTTYDISYVVRGWENKLLYITTNTTQNSLTVFVESLAQKGEVTLTIPRALLDSKSAYGNQDTQFIVLVDNKEVKYTETTSLDSRTLTVPFEFGAKKIEIISTQNI